ncbi:MAG: glutamine-hydrolyzing GMP synthase [Candidatus Marinimicrobia bacterium]|nr:glutamine-hydrolyzing GMP synthase [Candidatus Neomarinimicrobiota bacterium]
MDFKKGGVVIIDFGSQYTKLIARRVREKHVYSEIFSPDTKIENILKNNPKAIILSGGPSSVNDRTAPNFDKKILQSKIPVLGICYGLQLLIKYDGGNVNTDGNGEYGFANITIKNSQTLFKGVKLKSKVWMSHGDQVNEVPNGWDILAFSSNKIIAAVSNQDQTKFATQFHPEVAHTKEGSVMISNFLFNIAKCKPDWTPTNFIEQKIKSIQKYVKNCKVLVGVSGGVDSSVVAALVNKAIGENMHAVLIDHGLMRKNEAKDCKNFLKNGLGIEINLYDESKIFLEKLKGVVNPEEKRKIIGNQFIYSFNRIAKNKKNIKYLGQGTLYPDVIESGMANNNTSHLIKSHHNVGGLPDNMEFELVEPLRELFKDEVRSVGRELGLSKKLTDRHPFPGPGLGVRIIGEINRKRIKILQEADKIFLEILEEDNLYNDIWQAFAVLIPVKTVGVMGDQRTYENLIALRAVTSTDGMTADWFRMPNDTLLKISNRIVNNVKGVNRVVYDITSKPPGTIEWE